MNMSTKTWKVIIYTIVSAGVLCGTQNAKSTVFFRLVSLVFGCGWRLFVGKDATVDILLYLARKRKQA